MGSNSIRPNSDRGYHKCCKKQGNFCENDCPVDAEISDGGKPIPIDEKACGKIECNQSRADYNDADHYNRCSG